MANQYPATKPEGNFETISLREFGRRRGCTERAVRQAFDAGKIPTGIFQTKEMKRCAVAYQIADREWDEAGGAAHKLDRITHTKQNEDSEPAQNEKDDTAPDSLASIKKKGALLSLQRQQIEMAELTKQLLRKDKVHAALFSIGQEVRDALQRIPARVIDDMLAAPSRAEALLILVAAIDTELERIADLATREIA